MNIYEFQSTPPARGATRGVPHGERGEPHFNPRPPRGGRPDVDKAYSNGIVISIHAPREGGDSKDAQFYL